MVGFFRGLVMMQGPGDTWVMFISGQVFRCQYFQVSGFSGVPFSRGHIFQRLNFLGVKFFRSQVFRVQICMWLVFVGSVMVSF